MKLKREFENIRGKPVLVLHFQPNCYTNRRGTESWPVPLTGLGLTARTVVRPA